MIDTINNCFLVTKEFISLVLTLFTLCLLAQTPDKLVYQDIKLNTSQIMSERIARYANPANSITAPIYATDSLSSSPLSKERIDDYLKLKNLGYSERAIFEDLGNVNLLAENYSAAVYWYNKLFEHKDDNPSDSYYNRYQYALEKVKSREVSISSPDKDWLPEIEEDYKVKKESPRPKPTSSIVDLFKGADPNSQIGQYVICQFNLGIDSNIKEELINPITYKTKATITADGNTIFFSKAISMKPPRGIFSKKELVYKIYKAHKIGDQLKNIQELVLCPKYYSALHPTVSDDGKHLFFASDMPGSYGKYDIYISSLRSDGTFGDVKNLGKKVNTKENDLCPNFDGDNTLFYASDGRGGHDRLNVYKVPIHIDQEKVGQASKLDIPMNNNEDEYSIHYMGNK